MRDSAFSKKQRRQTAEPTDSDAERLLFRFAPTDLQELRELLGDKLDDALSSLQLGATMYRVARESKISFRKPRGELSRLEALLRRVEKTDARLSRDANLVLERFLNWFEGNTSPTVSARQTLSAAIRACAQTRALLSPSYLRRKSGDSARHFLAHAVAGALTAARLPLSKGRDGLFAQVLTVVWYAVNPARAPTEVFPLLQEAVAVARLFDPALLKAPRGRPPKKK